MKSLRRKMLWSLAIIILLWLIFAQVFLTFRQSDEDARKDFEKANVPLTTSTLFLGNHHLHYALTGRSDLPTLYFIHGSPGSWDAFEKYMKDKDLLQRFRMVSVDRPGFGQSDYGKPEHLATQSELIHSLVKFLDNHQPVFVAGHSLGGPLVLKLAADNPGAFSGLVIISGSIDPAEEKPEKWRPIFFKSPLNYLVPGAMRPSNEELWYLKKDLVDLQQDLPNVTTPVYFIHGEKDTWVPPANIDYGRKMLTHAGTIITTLISGANHFIPWTKFAEIKAVFLTLH
jgi:pimeloyl-ACP methyl ester carboxylesterase